MTSERKTRGKPILCVRLEPQIIEMLKERAEPAHGRSGGAALLVRRLVYDFLGEPLPEQFGDKGRSSKLRTRGGKRGWPKGRPRSLHAEWEWAPTNGFGLGNGFQLDDDNGNELCRVRQTAPGRWLRRDPDGTFRVMTKEEVEGFGL